MDMTGSGITHAPFCPTKCCSAEGCITVSAGIVWKLGWVIEITAIAHKVGHEFYYVQSWSRHGVLALDVIRSQHTVPLYILYGPVKRPSLLVLFNRLVSPYQGYATNVT